MILGDFKQLHGHSIPYRELGYNTLQSLLENEPGFSIRRGPQGEILVDTVSMQKASANIAQLVSKQKTAKKSHVKYPPPVSS
jgi:hypothetical protein